METDFPDSLMNRKYLFKIEAFCNNVKVFLVTFGLFTVPNKSIHTDPNKNILTLNIWTIM